MNHQHTARLHSPAPAVHSLAPSSLEWTYPLHARQATQSAQSPWPVSALLRSPTTDPAKRPKHTNLKQSQQNQPRTDRLPLHSNPLDINHLNLHNHPCRLVLGQPGPRENPQTPLSNRSVSKLL